MFSKKLLFEGTTAALLPAACRASFAQSCAMCYTSAAAANEAGTKALQHGIEILMLPPMLIFLGIFVVAFRRSRNGDREH